MIVGYLGKVVKEPLVVTICSVFGVVLDAASYLPAGKSLNRYSCAGLYSHYTQASGSSKVYNRTYRYVYYEGYEEVDGYLRAQIDSSSKTVEFDKGQSYYYDYPLQVQPRMSSRLHPTQRLMESKARESLTKKANGSDPAILRQFLMYRDKRNAGN
mgnify:CR=1 FL=1